MQKIPQKSLEYRVYRDIIANHLVSLGDNIVVAFSGGPDSTVLLRLLLNLKEKLKISVSACHYNHKLRGNESDQDEKFVKKICDQWGIEYLLSSAPKKNSFKNEQEARDARYNFFENILESRGNSKIAVGHNLSDNVETLLLRLVRGSGICGLTSIPQSRGKFIRPLLKIKKSEILNYAKTNSLPYRIDSSNLSTEFSRNFIRSQIVPKLKDLNPSLEDTINGFIESVSYDCDYLTEQTRKTYDKLASEIDGRIVLNREAFVNLHPSMQYHLVRFIFSKMECSVDITKKQLDEVIGVIQKGEGKKFKLLPCSLRVALVSGNIIISKNNI